MTEVPDGRLAAATALCALTAIVAAISVGQPSVPVFVFKPLTTLLVIAYAWRRGGAQPVARRWLLAGLVCSLAGDVAMMWPQQGFLPGLAFFLLAHLAYLAAFTREQRFAARPLAFVVYAAVAMCVLSQLWQGVPAALRIPVAVYVVCLASMAAQAAVLWLAARGTPAENRAQVLAIGGALFVLSDSLIAVNRFATPLPWAPLWILASYWLAQWCIASWLGKREPRGQVHFSGRHEK